MTFSFCHAQPEDVVWITPPALKTGDLIAIVAPAGVVDADRLSSFAKQVEAAGYRVRMADDIGRQWHYLAGTDQRRVDELNSAITDPEVRAIFPARGGYGLTRILDKIDYEALARDPKIITGFSDLTALHLAVARRNRLVTFHSPMPLANLWNTQQPEYSYSIDLFWRQLEARRYPPGIVGLTIPLPQDPKVQALRPGKARGRLLGGNLSLIATTLGTSFGIQPKGAILFIEDIEEAPYRVDRMLSELRLAGVLDHLAGAILGDFSYQSGKQQTAMERVLMDYFQHVSYPVVWKFPVGHVTENATLPHGALVELNADLGQIHVLENPVRLE